MTDDTYDPDLWEEVTDTYLTLRPLDNCWLCRHERIVGIALGALGIIFIDKIHPTIHKHLLRSGV